MISATRDTLQTELYPERDKFTLILNASVQTATSRVSLAVGSFGSRKGVSLLEGTRFFHVNSLSQLPFSVVTFQA